MRKNLLATLLMFAWVTSLCCQTRDTEAQIKAKCEQYLKIPLPEEASLVAAPKNWPECNSYKLYSGIGTKVDFAATRKCAWAERSAYQADVRPEGNYTIASVLGGAAMLTVLYMNGEGVKQDRQLAMRFACETGIGDHFEEMVAINAKIGPPGKKFKYCDYVVSMFEINFCVAYESEIADQKRIDALHSMSSGWPKEQQDEFKTLMRANEAYVVAHGRGETDLGGTIRGVRVNGVEERLRDKFLAALQAFESGHFPHGTAIDYKKADAALNLLYRRALAVAEAHKKDYEGSIQPEGIQNAEQAWLKYRDEWVIFAKLHYPSTDADAWLTLLTTNRAESLRMTLCGINNKDSECPQR
jgi:hypothetical protein